MGFIQNGLLVQLGLGAVLALVIGDAGEISRWLGWSLIGTTLLFFAAGLEFKPSEIAGKLKVFLWVLILTFVLTAFASYAFCLWIGFSQTVSLVVSALITTSGTGVTVQCLMENKKMNDPSSQFLVGLSAVDDLPSTLMLSIVLNQVGHASRLDLTHLASYLGLAALATVAWKMAPKVLPRSMWRITFIGCLGAWAFGQFTGMLGMTNLMGALAIGFGFQLIDAKAGDSVKGSLSQINRVVLPFYFVMVGSQMIPQSLGSAKLWTFVIALSAIAFVFKFFPAFWLLKNKQSAWVDASEAQINPKIIAWGLVPRGVPGLAFAFAAVKVGVIDNELYTALVLVVALTTFVGLFGLQQELRAETKTRLAY